MRPLAPTFEPDRWVPPPELIDGYRISEFLRSGRPKGAVHTHGGFPYALVAEMGL